MSLVVDSFRGPFIAQDGDSHVMVPPGWMALWDPGRTRPEYKPKQAPDPNIYDGDWAASMHVRYASHNGFLLRTMSLGTYLGPVKATVMAMLDSHPKSAHGVRIGIGQGPDVDPLAEGHAWSPWWATHNPEYVNRDWVELEVETIATDGSITIMLQSKNDWAHELSASHFDLVQVRTEGDENASLIMARAALSQAQGLVLDLVVLVEELR